MAIHEVLSALADDKRREILCKLKEGRISSGDLAAAVNLTPQALSYHLSRLKKADLIYETRHKNFIYYELNLSVLDEVLLWMHELRSEGGHLNETKYAHFPFSCSVSNCSDSYPAVFPARTDSRPL